METNFEKGLRNFFLANLINATVITFVCYFVFFQMILDTYKSFKDKRRLTVGKKTGEKCNILKKVGGLLSAVIIASGSLLLIVLPFPWQFQAYEAYQSYSNHLESSKRLEELQLRLEKQDEE
ncbi:MULTISPECIES: hypothetical protein [Gammaproteobacteria]|uniref:hypothetical protein n=1 Tax=Gammaproteobacteria TaxID=1236 RepID=UPI000F7FD6BF|nr:MULTISPECIES: hypothetical protein [Gammaproteobacteria]RTE85494.1 hypothetical protein DQX04_11365 [Aliidiomarina sp. B3213]TCZ89462.1 hypothetical protein EYQ95_11285 [Lysobacter sp. N42]